MSRPQRYSTGDWNAAAAMYHIDRPMKDPTIKDGKITKAVVVDGREKRASNIHTLAEDQPEESDLHHTHLDYDHSKKLPSQNFSNERIIGTTTGKKLGGRGPSKASYASRVAVEKSKVNDPVQYSVTFRSDLEHKGGTRPSDPFKALAQSIYESSNLPPHSRTPSTTASQDTRGSQASNSHLAYEKLYSSVQESTAIQESMEGFSHLRDTATSLPEFQSSNLRSTAMHSKFKETTESGLTMNSRLAAKSAAKDSAFPCSYLGCTEGFSRAKDLKRHKDAEHEWCSVCNLDFKDDVALIEHRKASTMAGEGKHIACLVCGDDFKCEAGHIRHTKLAHPEAQDLRCPGCGEKFARGAGLLAHVHSNRCKDRSGLVSETKVATGRIHAALEMEKLSSVPHSSQTGTQYDPEEQSTVSGGGVSVEISESLMDKCGDLMDQTEVHCDRLSLEVAIKAERPGDYESLSSDDSTGTEIEASRGRSRVSDLENHPKDQESTVEEPLKPLSIVESDKSPSTIGWSKGLFPDAQPTPNVSNWKQPKAQPPASRRSRQADDNNISAFDLAVDRAGKRIRTDWDHYKFETDPMGKFKCPFQRCQLTYTTLSAAKTHLISGYHAASDNRCVKCLKAFEKPIGLLAHMESASLKCNVRNTEQYGHLLYMVSGGFVDVNNDERGAKLSDGQLRMRAPTRAELLEQQAVYEEAQRERERRLAAEW